MSVRSTIAGFLERLAQSLAVTAVVDDSSGWSRVGRPVRHDRDHAEVQELYTDTLTAWRKNPLAWRMIAITTNYVVGEGISLSSSNPDIQRFIEQFWDHPDNMIDNRLEQMCDELSRAGDLFPLLFLDRATGMSVLRFLTKDEILQIETRKNDREAEMVYYQATGDVGEPEKRWYSPRHGRAPQLKAVCLHYSVNRPIGALMGEGDLVSAIPWLLRYSRLLEDRIRFHWAIRAFLWFVRVPAGKVEQKAEQYETPPEFGSVVVLEDGEEWEAKSPVIRGADAAPDMKAVRGMVDAASGYPPHWRGEATDVNLATAQAMQEPAERHLVRRQLYFVYILSDLVYQAYVRAHQVQPLLWPAPPAAHYKTLFTAVTPDISKSDNPALALAAKDLTLAYRGLVRSLPNKSKSLSRSFLSLILQFAGEKPNEEELDQIMVEAFEGADTAVGEDDNPDTAGEVDPLLGRVNGMVYRVR